jgi:hypothetical protein
VYLIQELLEFYDDEHYEQQLDLLILIQQNEKYEIL